MKTDPRILFIIMSLHGLVLAGENLGPDELDGLKLILEAIVIDGREDHAQER